MDGVMGRKEGWAPGKVWEWDTVLKIPLLGLPRTCVLYEISFKLGGTECFWQAKCQAEFYQNLQVMGEGAWLLGPSVFGLMKKSQSGLGSGIVQRPSGRCHSTASYSWFFKTYLAVLWLQAFQEERNETDEKENVLFRTLFTEDQGIINIPRFAKRQ